MIKKIIFLILITISFTNIAYAWHSKSADTPEKEVKTKDGKVSKIIKKGTDKLNTDSKLTSWVKKKFKK